MEQREKDGHVGCAPEAVEAPLAASRRLMGIRAWAREESPWKRCKACPTCQWWTGWQCLQEAANFPDCPEYGVSFVETVVAIDRRTGKGKYVTLAKGQTTDDLMRAARASEPEGVGNVRGDADGAGAPRGINFKAYLRQLETTQSAKAQKKEVTHG